MQSRRVLRSPIHTGRDQLRVSLCRDDIYDDVVRHAAYCVHTGRSTKSETAKCAAGVVFRETDGPYNIIVFSFVIGLARLIIIIIIVISYYSRPSPIGFVIRVRFPVVLSKRTPAVIAK